MLALAERFDFRFEAHALGHANRSAPFELLAAERPHLRPLPAFVPEVYDLHTRRVDVEGYVTLHGNRYSMPAALIGRSVEIRESSKQVRVFDGRSSPNSTSSTLRRRPRGESGRIKLGVQNFWGRPYPMETRSRPISAAPTFSGDLNSVRMYP
jgi:hypothetical protein